MKKKLFRWIKVFALLYAVIGIAWYYGQERLIFHPEPVDAGTVYHFDQPFREVNLNYNAATNLNLVEFRPADSPARGVVLYFHGNRQNITRYAAFAKDFTVRGYEVWMLDYPGYGKSTGSHAEKDLYAYALIFYKLARSRYTPNQIILYGKSLGTGIAAQLAAVRDCRRLILETPYYSMTSLFRRYLPVYPVSTMLHYHFPTNEYLPAVAAPITIFQGTSDGIVPYGNAERLKPLLKAGDEFIAVPGGSHNDLHDFSLFRQKLDSVLGQ
jgi:alpha-beta hydrolase superfamily lysophospholipase